MPPKLAVREHNPKRDAWQKEEPEASQAPPPEALQRRRGNVMNAASAFQVGRPKPPPPPKPTPAELRIARVSEALCNLCDLFEELAQEELEQETKLRRVASIIPQRLSEISEELPRAKAALQEFQETSRLVEQRSSGLVASSKSSLNRRSSVSDMSVRDMIAAAGAESDMRATSMVEESALKNAVTALEQEKQDLEQELAKNRTVVDELRPGNDDERLRERWNKEAVEHLDLMLNCSARTVRKRAASTLAVVAEGSAETKRLITARGQTENRSCEGIAPKLVKVSACLTLASCFSAMTVCTMLDYPCPFLRTPTNTLSSVCVLAAAPYGCTRSHQNSLCAVKSKCDNLQHAPRL